MCVILTACTSGPTADVTPLEAAVNLASGDTDANAVTEKVTASQGDVISTDTGGLAEVGFPDGSFMRLGPESEIEITELGSAEAQRTSIALDIGTTWHNVQKLVGEDSVYEVVTPVGVASVRGTVFTVTCTEGPSCTFVVLEGRIDVDGIAIEPYQRITLPAESEPQVIPFGTLGAWADANIDRDSQAEDAAPLPAPPLEAASIAGEWKATLTTTATNSIRDPVGTAEDVTWTLGEPTCDPDCSVSVSSSAGWETSADLVDGVVTFSRSGPFECVYEETGEPSGETGTFEYSYRFAIAEADEARTSASSLTGSLSGSMTLDIPGTCELGRGPGVFPVDYERDIEMVRVG